MNNLKKVGLTALGTALVTVGSAQAATMSVTGGTSLNFNGQDNNTLGNGWTMTDSITFAASGDMDNGIGVSLTMELDGNVMDTRTLAFTTDMGTLTFSGDGSSGPIGSWDDMTPTANEEAHGSTLAGTMAGATNAAGTNDIFVYDYTVMDGLALKASYTPSDGATEIESSMDYGLMYTGISNFTLYAAMGEDNGSVAKLDNSVFGVKYATDMGFTIGYQVNESDSTAANGDEDFTAIGVSYMVSDDLSVSYNISEIDFEGGTNNQEATGVSFSYTSGGMTISGSHHQVDNVGGTGSADNTGYELNFGFAF